MTSLTSHYIALLAMDHADVQTCGPSKRYAADHACGPGPQIPTPDIVCSAGGEILLEPASDPILNNICTHMHNLYGFSGFRLGLPG